MATKNSEQNLDFILNNYKNTSSNHARDLVKTSIDETFLYLLNELKSMKIVATEIDKPILEVAQAYEEGVKDGKKKRLDDIIDFVLNEQKKFSSMFDAIDGKAIYYTRKR